MHRFVATVLIALIASTNSLIGCSPIWGRSVDKFLAEADCIVVARAVDYVPFDALSTDVYGPGKSTVAFDVIEVLSGKLKAKRIELVGALSGEDDYNDGDIPYQMVRPNGRHGSCYAYHYRKGALYLLVLKKVEGKLTTYWDPLKPCNEQVQSTNDPWVAWVKAYLAKIWKVS